MDILTVLLSSHPAILSSLFQLPVCPRFFTEYKGSRAEDLWAGEVVNRYGTDGRLRFHVQAACVFSHLWDYRREIKD